LAAWAANRTQIRSGTGPARLMGQWLSEHFGQQFIIENWPRPRLLLWVICGAFKVLAPCPVHLRSLPTGARQSRRPWGATGQQQTHATQRTPASSV